MSEIGGMKSLYCQLHRGEKPREALVFMKEQLDEVRSVQEIEFSNVEEFIGRIYSSHEQTLIAYEKYIREDKRRLFTSKCHAKWFIIQEAPTKLVDGIWLKNWREFKEPVRSILRQIYEDEIGMEAGHVNTMRNHVEIYKNLIKKEFPRFNDLDVPENWLDNPLMEDETGLFIQPLIQMTLANFTDRYLPEIVGYNLGYEQLPLHMAMTVKEMEEFGIDPYYFSLHITVDNMSTGHARKSVEAARAYLQQNPDDLQRVVSGFLLNQLGTHVESLCSRFSVMDVVNRILFAKGSLSYSLHDKVNIGNGNLSEAMVASEANLWEALEDGGYINYGGSFNDTLLYRSTLFGGVMYGVFTPYELEFMKELYRMRAKENKDSDIKSQIHRIFSREGRKHKRVMFNDPNGDGGMISAADLQGLPIEEFWKVMDHPATKSRVRKSFSTGKMKNVLLSDEDRKAIETWLSL